MITLSYGYKLPQTNDKGPQVFPALEGNIQQLNDHDHDGTNSSKLPGSSVASATVSIPSGSWVALGGGNYRQQVTMPASYLFDEVQISIRLNDSSIVYATVEKISNTQFWVYSNDNTVTMKAVVG